MGQQLSAENYCLATVQKLAAELNTTDSQVSECRVDTAEGSDSWTIAFPWREWARVSKYLERILPNCEQKRLLQLVLLQHTGLDRWELTEAWDPAGLSGLQLSSDSHWSVHLNYGDDTGTNAVLYKDFVKLHFQLNSVFSGSRLSSMDSGLSMSAGEEQQPDCIGALVERVTEAVRRQCGGIGINLLVTNAQYHSRDNCLVVSGTIDIRSILRNSASVQLRSRVNYRAADQELSDQVQRSLSGLRDKIAKQQLLDQSVAGWFPMTLHYCEDSKRVGLAYVTKAQADENPNGN